MEQKMIFKFTEGYAVDAAKGGYSLIAVLEDMAQVAGYMVPVISEGEEQRSPVSLIKAAAEGEIKAAIIDGGSGDITLLVEAESREEADKIFDIVEKNARAILEGEKLGGAVPIDEVLAKEERQFYLESYSKAEKENVLKEERPFPLAAEALVDLSESLLGIGCLKWTWGNLSIRFGKGDMLITPSGRRYEGLTGADMVKVNIESGEYEGEIKPSSEKDLHRLIYRDFPEARVIIHTHAPSSSVFAAARKPLKLEPVEIDGVLVGERSTLFVSDFAKAGTMELAENAVKAMKSQGSAKGALLANHGMLCFGEDIDDVFNTCRWIEKEAERSLNV